MTGESDFAGAWIETEDRRRLPVLGNFRLGRSAHNHVIIDGPKASRDHAAIHVQDENEFWIMDLGSRNGTFLNNQRVILPTRLRDGDRFMLAGATFTFRQPAAGYSGDSTSGAGNATVTEFKDVFAWLLLVDIEGFAQLSQQWPPDKLAVSIGRWVQDGQRLVEKNGGRLSKFLGDGFLACWEAGGDKTQALVEVLHGFHALRTASEIKFRVILHHGLVTFGGAVQSGEENMIGAELNYIFRLEKLASELGITYCLSEKAQGKLQPYLPLQPVPGEHPLKGFPGTHRCFAIHWP